MSNRFYQNKWYRYHKCSPFGGCHGDNDGDIYISGGADLRADGVGPVSMTKQKTPYTPGPWTAIADPAHFDSLTTVVGGAVNNAMPEEAEPVAEIIAEDMGAPFNAIRVTAHFFHEIPPIGSKLYLHPPAPRPAVRLSVGEISELSESILHCRKTGLSHIPYGTNELCRAIEAAVLKKNGLEVKDETTYP